MKKPLRIPLAEEVNLNMITTDRFKSSRLSFFIIRPLSKEENTKFALLPSVLRAGSKNYPSRKEINTRLDSLYGAELSCFMDKKGEAHIAALSVRFLSDRFRLDDTNIAEGVLDLLLKILLNPKVTADGFDHDIVKIEKENLKKRIAAQINDKRSYAVTRCTQIMCKDEAYSAGEWGELSDVDAIDEKELYSFYLDVLKTSRIEIFYTGDKTEQELSKPLTDAFSSVNRGEILPIETCFVEECEDVETFEESMDVNQCKLTIGMRTGITGNSPDFPALVMANVLFGGSPVSKLFINVREKLSLCYYAASRVEMLKGLLLVYSGVEEKNVQTALTEIKHQLELLQKGEVTDEEYSAARKAVINSIRSVYDSPRAMEDFSLAQTFLLNGKSLEEYMEDIKNVTCEQAVAASKKFTLDTVYILKGKGEQKND